MMPVYSDRPPGRNSAQPNVASCRVEFFELCRYKQGFSSYSEDVYEPTHDVL